MRIARPRTPLGTSKVSPLPPRGPEDLRTYRLASYLNREEHDRLVEYCVASRQLVTATALRGCAMAWLECTGATNQERLDIYASMQEVQVALMLLLADLLEDRRSRWHVFRDRSTLVQVVAGLLDEVRRLRLALLGIGGADGG